MNQSEVPVITAYCSDSSRAIAVSAAVVVVEVVEVFDDPPLIDGFTLMIGSTVIVGELLIDAIAVALGPPCRRCPDSCRP